MKVHRSDSMSLSGTYFTKEGYLVDHPIVTSTGIFEYKNRDGSIRRELRLPEEVFSKRSLGSYKGKPIIVTHSAGYVNKANVEKEQIGTMLSDGYQDGENVRAEIIIHDTDRMESSGLRELSLGYDVDLDETAGVYQGERYDAIQRNIVINHLALVSNARAGEQARLNLDSRDDDTLTGGRKMNKETREDSLSPEELSEAIEAFKQRRNERMSAAKPVEVAHPMEEPVAQPDLVREENEDTEKPIIKNPEEEVEKVPEVEPVAEPVVEKAEVEEKVAEPVAQPEEKLEAQPEIEAKPVVAEPVVKEEPKKDPIQSVKDRRDERDLEGDPEDLRNAMGMIARQDEDIDTLLGVIDVLMSNKAPQADARADSVDGEKENFKELLKVVRMGDKLHMDGLDELGVIDAKKAIVKRLKPKMNLDGKSEAYVSAAYDMCITEVVPEKSTDKQRQQMMRKDSGEKSEDVGSALDARQRMVKKIMKED